MTNVENILSLIDSREGYKVEFKVDIEFVLIHRKSRTKNRGKVEDTVLIHL